MSFWIYHLKDSSAEQVNKLKLAGAKGIFSQFLKSNAEADTPFAWQLTSAEIIQLADPELDPEQHIVAIDLLPESFTEACFYRVTHMQGVSECDESDIVLACKTFFQGPSAATQFKKTLPIIEQENDRQMLEAMRLTGGTLKGTYRWARPKMDIGAAVCPSNETEMVIH